MTTPQALGAAVTAPPDSRTRQLALWWQRSAQARRSAIQHRRSRHAAPSSSALASLTSFDFHRQL